MPANTPDSTAVVAALHGYDGSAWDPWQLVAATATQDETATQYLRIACALYGWDGADLSRVLVESAAAPNVRAALYDGAAGPADIAAAAVTLDETAATFLKVMAAQYGMGTADLERLLTASAGIGTLQDTAGTGILPSVLLGVFDNTAPASTTENQFGALRMSAQRVLYTTAPAVSVDVNSAVVADVDAAVGAATGLRLIGFSARETASATAEFHIVNGATGAAGTKIVRVTLAANESAREWFWPGIDAASGISIDWVSGSIDVDIYNLTLA